MLIFPHRHYKDTEYCSFNRCSVRNKGFPVVRANQIFWRTTTISHGVVHRTTTSYFRNYTTYKNDRPHVGESIASALQKNISVVLLRWFSSLQADFRYLQNILDIWFWQRATNCFSLAVRRTASCETLISNTEVGVLSYGWSTQCNWSTLTWRNIEL